MAARDPYAVLGVDKKASQEVIKKAHRKLVRELHPDHNPGDARAEERFKEVQSAYDVLGDPEKRKAHDRGQMNPFGGGGGPGNPFGGGFPGGAGGAGAESVSDLLKDLFGTATGRGGAGGRAAPTAGPVRGADLEAEVRLSFDQAVEGAQIALRLDRSEMCPTCGGTGAKPGTSPRVCPKCSGRGVESQGEGLFSISKPCSRCGGSGTVIDDACVTCHGSGARRTVKPLRVNVPAGVKDGSRVRVAGKGEPGRRNGPPGDLYVVTRVSESSVFARKGVNVEVEVPLTIPEALRGAEVEVPTLDGRKKLRVPPGTKHGTVQRLRGEGPPKLGSRERGDIRYRFVIEIPDTLSPEQSAAVDELAKLFAGDPRAKLMAAAKSSRPTAGAAS